MPAPSVGSGWRALLNQPGGVSTSQFQTIALTAAVPTRSATLSSTQSVNAFWTLVCGSSAPMMVTMVVCRPHLKRVNGRYEPHRRTWLKVKCLKPGRVCVVGRGFSSTRNRAPWLRNRSCPIDGGRFLNNRGPAPL